MNVPALIALGGNTGDVRATFGAALRTLNETPRVTVTAASRAYRTPAVGANAGGEFLNAAATLETTLSPHRLLSVLQRLEEDAGRARTVHWGPRSLDVDLILYGEERIDGGPLTVPHPGLAWRRFVLDPACEVAADWPTPRFLTVRDRRNALLKRPLRIGTVADDAYRRALAAAVEPEFPVAVVPWAAGAPRRSFPALWLSREGKRQAGLSGAFALPHNVDGATAVLRDLLAAALPDPEPQPVGEPLWPGVDAR